MTLIWLGFMNTEFKLYEICTQQMYRTFELEVLILQVREQVTDDSCRLQGRGVVLCVAKAQ